MNAGTVHLVTDPKVKGRVAMAIGRQMDLEAEQVQEPEQETLWADEEGRFMVRTQEEELYIFIPLSNPLLRIVEPEGIGRVAEEWLTGHCISMQDQGGSSL
jgi:hypothetical protein